MQRLDLREANSRGLWHLLLLRPVVEAAHPRQFQLPGVPRLRLSRKVTKHSSREVDHFEVAAARA